MISMTRYGNVKIIIKKSQYAAERSSRDKAAVR